MRLINLDQSLSTYTIELPGREIKEAFVTNTYEDVVAKLELENSKVKLELPYKKITTVELQF